MERIPCPPSNEECKYHPLCFEDVHHIYGRANADNPLEQTFCELPENKRINCRDYHEKEERELGWPDYPEVPVMVEAIGRAIANGEVSFSKRRMKKIKRAIQNGRS